ncbi:ATP-binding protein [Stenotrophomonas sp.]|uniref:sensor histidine kinase n=2 Tax=unclassified Stenotrophomonas TaxID=196198 RepID=UPI0028A94930|nr:ATP-binding protein [Stenotrophomonas sp.]
MKMMENMAECVRAAQPQPNLILKGSKVGSFIKRFNIFYILKRWLISAPVDDPVDRRNAPFLQVLLIFLGIFIPLNKSLFLYAVLSGQWSGPVANLRVLVVDLSTDVLMTLAMWTGVWLIRTGRFRWSLRLFLAVVLLSMAASYVATGVAGLPFDPMPIILLALGGLILGRRALWLTFSMLLMVLIATLIVDSSRAALGAGAMQIGGLGKALSLAGVWLIISIIFDRTVAALRHSLDESNARGRELELAYRKLQEETRERERARGQLIHAQKMEAIGRLASGAAHDFNNVLSIILGYAAQRDSLADSGTKALYDAMEAVDIAAKRALAISRKLLNFSRQEVANPEVFDVRFLLQELLPMLKQLFGSRVRLGLDCADSALPVRMDVDHFGLAIINIAANSRDAIADIGTFHIQAERSDAAWVSLTCSDDGVGMSEDVRMQAFEAFFTTKPSGMGTGLGLSVVRDMIVQAGGKVEFDTQPKRGTTVRILLPLAVGS